jgi:G3E family GTPase
MTSTTTQPLASDSVPVNVITGFLGSGKTTLLQGLLRSPMLDRTVVLINEFGEIGLDHLLVEKVDEAVVLLQNGCVCCSIRGDLNGALRSLMSRRERGEIPSFDRIVLETTGLADPAPILYTLAGEPVLRHHFALATVITTVDAVNAALHLSQNPEGAKQVAAADRLVITKTDLAEAAEIVVLHETLSRLNPSAEIVEAQYGKVDAEALLAPRPFDADTYTKPVYNSAPAIVHALGRHAADVASSTVLLDEPLDWTAFGIWLSMLLNRHGDAVLRVKGILSVQGMSAPVFINAVQHIVHPPQHMERWPSDDRRSRIVFITRGIDHAVLRRSLAAFSNSRDRERVARIV